MHTIFAWIVPSCVVSARTVHVVLEPTLRAEGQEVLKGMVEDKMWLQSRATENYYEQILEEMKELEQKKSKEAPLFVQKRHTLWRYQNERDEARRLQRSGSSRGTRKEADSQDLIGGKASPDTLTVKVGCK